MSKTEDGTGKGYLQKVNANNQAYTYATVTDEADQATKTGRSYNVNTGIVDLTDAVDTPVLYLKNNETESLHVTAIAVGMGPTTGGTGDIPVITVTKNPTAGTIISGATAVDVVSNRNYGSASTLNVDAYKGATGSTMTDGTDHLIIYQGAGGRAFATIDEVLPTGTSIGIKIDPQASNTSMEVYCALICHLEDANA